MKLAGTNAIMAGLIGLADSFGPGFFVYVVGCVLMLSITSMANWVLPK